MRFEYAPAERRAGDLLVSSDRARLDVAAVHAMLAASYWAANVPREVVERSIAGSMAFGVYHAPPALPDESAELRQIGFARVVTDGATFAYLADVIVDEAWRGRGVGTLLVETILELAELAGLRRWMLITRDAHGLYAPYGFVPTVQPGNVMERRRANAYGSGG